LFKLIQFLTLTILGVDIAAQAYSILNVYSFWYLNISLEPIKLLRLIQFLMLMLLGINIVAQAYSILNVYSFRYLSICLEPIKLLQLIQFLMQNVFEHLPGANKVAQDLFNY
jgi:hypothetical protein